MTLVISMFFAYWPESNLLVTVECKYNQPPFTMKDSRRLRDRIFGKAENDRAGQFSRIFRPQKISKLTVQGCLNCSQWPQPESVPLRNIELYVSRDVYLLDGSSAISCSNPVCTCRHFGHLDQNRTKHTLMLYEEDIKKTAITCSWLYLSKSPGPLRSCAIGLMRGRAIAAMKFENVIMENEAPQGLDDIVIERRMASVDLQQIKVHPRFWDIFYLGIGCWRKRQDRAVEIDATQMVWCFQTTDPVRIGEISLITNRRPDAAIEVCLERDRIDPSKIPRTSAHLGRSWTRRRWGMQTFLQTIMYSDTAIRAILHWAWSWCSPSTAYGTPERESLIPKYGSELGNAKSPLRRMALD